MSKKKKFQKKFYVKGMHCASCEVLIEKKLLEQPEVERVEASTKDGSVEVNFTDNEFSINKLNSIFEGSGYKFTSKAPRKEKSGSIIKIENGELILNKQKILQLLYIIGIVLLITIGFILLNRSGISSIVSVNSSSSVISFFTFGLLAGMSSCAALVGGIILSMSKQWAELYSKSDREFEKIQPHIMFNSGRLISFTVFGAVLGAIGGFLSISLSILSIITIGIGIMMLVLGLQMLGFKAFQKFQFKVPKFISKYVTDETNFKGKYMPFIMGALTFILPCGFTITAQAIALTSGNAIQGALIMFSFALGTLPILLLIGLSSTKLLQKPNISNVFLKVAGVLVIFFALYNINSQLNVLGLPSLNDINDQSSVEASEDDFPPVVDGKQVVEMDASSYEYSPNYFKVRAGIPVLWKINNKGVSGCTNAVISRGLFEGEVKIDRDTVEKEFIPDEPGIYKFSCWMGMVSGSFEVVSDSNDKGDQEVVEVPSGASSCGGDESKSCSGSCGGSCGNSECQYSN